MMRKRLLIFAALVSIAANVETAQAVDVSSWSEINTNRTDASLNVLNDITVEGSAVPITLKAVDAQIIEGNYNSITGADGYSFALQGADVTFNNLGKYSEGNDEASTFSYKDLSGATKYVNIEKSVNSFPKYLITRYVNDTVLNVNNSVFTNNGGRIVALSWSNNNQILNIKDSIFYNNSSDQNVAIISGGNSSTITNIENSIFYNNHNTKDDGGAVDVTGNIIVKNSYFINNVADDGFSGAINLEGGILTVEGSKFQGNISGYGDGGAIAMETGSQIKFIKDTQFVDNSTTWGDGGAISTCGGGFIEGIDNVVFKGNKAYTRGGGMWAGMSTTASNARPPILIKNTTFEGNEAGDGGGLWTEGAARENYTYIVDSTFKDNTATGEGHDLWYGYARGGGLEVASGGVPLTINNTTFDGNKAEPGDDYSAGGAIYFVGKSPNFPIKIVDSTFKDNSALEGGALFVDNADTAIIAQTKDVVFSGNIASADADDYNGGADIYFKANKYSATLSLNADTGNKIIFNGSIASYIEDDKTSTININNSDVTYNTFDGETEKSNDAGTAGEIQFNARVGDAENAFSAINLYAGKLSIGQNEDSLAPAANPDGYINDNNFNVLGDSTLNTVNGLIGEFAPKAFVIANGVKLDYQMDVDLVNKKSDTLNVSAQDGSIENNGTLSLAAFNIFSDSAEQNLKIKYSDTNVGGVLKDNYTIITSNETYNVSTLNDDTGSYVIFSQVLPLGGLPAAIYTQADQYAITNGEDENVTAWAQDEGNVIKSDIDINGNGQSIYTEEGLDGLVVSQGTSAVLRNIDELTGFNNALTNNGGTLTVTDTNVVGNTGDADITNNGGTVTINANTKDVTIGSESTEKAIISDGGSVNIKGANDHKVTINGDLAASNSATINVDTDTTFNGNVSISGDTTKMNINADTEIDTLTNAGSVVNKGSMTLKGGENSGSISGTGSLIASGVDSFANSGSIEQNTINISNNTELNNTGTLTINESGSLDENSSISGAGSLVNNGIFNNNGTIEQKTLTNTNSFTSDASKLEISDGISNSNNLNLTGGTLDTSVIGDGTTNITGDVVVKYIHGDGTASDEHNKISQAINVAKTGSLNANVASVGGDISVNGEDNDTGVVTLYSQEENGGDLNNKVTGNGKVILNRNVNVNADVTAKTIEVSTYTSDGQSYNANVVVAEGKSFGNADGTITVAENNSLTMNKADDLATSVVNNGELKFVSGTNSKDISGDGETLISGNVNNKNNINNDVTVSDNANLINDGIVGADDKNIVNDGNITNNGNISGNTTNNGNIDNDAKITGTVINNSEGNISTSIAGLDADTTNYGDIHYTDSGATLKDIKGNGTVHIDGAGTTVLNNNINGNKLSLNNGTLVFGSNNDISQGGFVGNGGAIGNILDGKTSTYKLGNANLVRDTKVDGIDFDLNNLTSDKFIAQFSGNGKLEIDKVQVKGNTLKDSIKVFLGDTTKVDKAHLNVKNQKLPTIMTPIRRLAGRVEDNYLTYAGTGNSARDFNPAVLASPVASLIGGQITQSQVLQDSFFHMNRYMKYSSNARIASDDRNKYALSELNSYPAYVSSSLPETSQAMWVKPYTTFEKVKLKGGVGVSNVAYGTLYGGDTDLVDLGHGYKGVISAFVGYNGSHQSYNGISMNQQGGSLGVTGTLYHGNFFTGVTLSAGASAGEAHTPFGTDHFSMLTAGIANKTGYNIELADGKFIIQPTLYVGYTFVNNFDYKNSAGVNIDSDPLNTIQVAPGIKFIGNLKNGWQPYAGVDMIWNIMGKTKFKAADSRLPELSVKPYIQYGVGLQKSWSERFTAFFQTMLRNGGRSGIVLEGGFRWTFGGSKNNTRVQKQNGTVGNKKVVKSLKVSNLK